MLNELNRLRVDELASIGFLQGMKVETESEGLPWSEISRLRVLATSQNLPFSVKIGGVEAITDMTLASNLQVDEVIAPMVESPFAALKFIEASEKHCVDVARRRVLIETDLGIKSIQEILDVSEGNIDGVNFGRSDLAASLSLESKSKIEANSHEVTERLVQGLIGAKAAGLQTTMGGSISSRSLHYIGSNFSVLPDRLETRRFVFSTQLALENPNLVEALLSLELDMMSNFVARNNTTALRSSVYVGELESRLNQTQHKGSFI